MISHFSIFHHRICVYVGMYLLLGCLMIGKSICLTKPEPCASGLSFRDRLFVAQRYNLPQKQTTNRARPFKSQLLLLTLPLGRGVVDLCGPRLAHSPWSFPSMHLQMDKKKALSALKSSEFRMAVPYCTGGGRFRFRPPVLFYFFLKKDEAGKIHVIWVNRKKWNNRNIEKVLFFPVGVFSMNRSFKWEWDFWTDRRILSTLLTTHWTKPSGG